MKARRTGEAAPGGRPAKILEGAEELRLPEAAAAAIDFSDRAKLEQTLQRELASTGGEYNALIALNRGRLQLALRSRVMTDIEKCEKALSSRVDQKASWLGRILDKLELLEELRPAEEEEAGKDVEFNYQGMPEESEIVVPAVADSMSAEELGYDREEERPGDESNGDEAGTSKLKTKPAGAKPSAENSDEEVAFGAAAVADARGGTRAPMAVIKARVAQINKGRTTNEAAPQKPTLPSAAGETPALPAKRKVWGR